MTPSDARTNAVNDAIRYLIHAAAALRNFDLNDHARRIEDIADALNDEFFTDPAKREAR